MADATQPGIGSYLQSLMDRGVISPDRTFAGTGDANPLYVGNDGYLYKVNYYAQQDNQGNQTGDPYLGNVERINAKNVLSHPNQRGSWDVKDSKSDFLHPDTGAVVGSGFADWDHRSPGELATLAFLAFAGGGAAAAGMAGAGGAAAAGGTGTGAVGAGGTAGSTIGSSASLTGGFGGMPMSGLGYGMTTTLPELGLGAAGYGSGVGLGAGQAALGAAAAGAGGAALSTSTMGAGPEVAPLEGVPPPTAPGYGAPPTFMSTVQDALGALGGGGGAAGAAGGGGGAGGLASFLPTTAQGWAGLIAPALTAVSGAMQNSAAGDAAQAGVNAANNGIAENGRQFDVVRGLLQPYVTAGTGALGAYQNLSGLGGAPAQTQELAMLTGSPQFGSLAKQGEDAILQNASATGGLRGGNVQGGLANFRSNLLTSLIDKQLGRYGNVMQLGQTSAAGVGNAAMQTGQQNAQLMQQAGAAQSGGIVAGSNAITNALGGVGGFFAGQNASTPAAAAPAYTPYTPPQVAPPSFGSGVVQGYGFAPSRSF